MFELQKSIQNSTPSHPTRADVIRTVLRDLIHTPYGGIAAFQEIDLKNHSWMWVEDHRQENRVVFEFRAGDVPLYSYASQMGIRLPAPFILDRLDDIMQTEIWECGQTLTEKIVEDLIPVIELICKIVFTLPEEFVLSGWIQNCYPPDPNSWPYKTNTIRESLRYTIPQLREKIKQEKEPDRWILLLAERTPDWSEKLDLLRQIVHTTDRALEPEVNRVWDRLDDIIPQTTLTYIDGIKDFSGWEGVDMDTSHGNSYWESRYEIFEAPVQEHPGAHPRYGFSGGRHSRGIILSFEQIYKLSSGDYLCGDEGIYYLYQEKQSDFLFPAGIVSLEGDPTPGKVLDSVKEHLPEAYEGLSRRLWKNPDREGYISSYRHFIWGFDDFIFDLADGLVLMDDQFQVTPYKIQ